MPKRKVRNINLSMGRKRGLDFMPSVNPGRAVRSRKRGGRVPAAHRLMPNKFRTTVRKKGR